MNAPRTPAPRVALVQPPFGAGILPGLGLALLAAELKRRGVESRIFYWDLDLLAGMPGRTPRDRYQAFSELTSRPWFPYNEWIFARAVHDDRLDARAPALRERLYALARNRRNGEAIADHVLALRADVDGVLDRMADQLSGYDLVGVSTTFLQNLPALALARRVKERWPEKLVVLGGANCDGEMGAVLLERFPFLDFIFAGEVDHAFPAFVERHARGEAPAAGVPGLGFRDAQGGPHPSASAPPLADLDALPIPDYSDYQAAFARAGLEGFLKLTLSLESSRGCWWGERHHCTFCGLNAGGMAFRRKTPDRFAWEVEQVARRYSVRYLYMTDNILAVDYYGSFLGQVRRSGADVEFFYEIKSNVTRRQVARLTEGRVSYIRPGIEHFSSAILERMRKGVTGIQNVSLLRLAREHGILVDYTILTGFPGEERDEYDRLAQELPKLTHLRPPVAVTPIEYHRFSPYHQQPEAFGLTLRPWSEYRELYPLDDGELARIAYVFEDQATVPRREHLRKLLEQVRRWVALYSEARCTLSWTPAGDDVVVTDTRPSYGPRRYRLRGFAAETFRLLDEPRPLASLVRAADEWRPRAGPELPGVSPDEELVEFDATALVANPDAALRPLREAGLVFEEQLARAPADVDPQPWLLALPVPAQRRPINADWLVY